MDHRSPQRTDEFIRLLTQHQPAVFLFIVSLLPQRADAEEVLQETNLLLWKKFDQYQTGTNFRAWATQIASYRAKKFIESAARSKLQFSEQFFDKVASVTDDANQRVEQRHVALHQCLDELPQKDRKLVELRYLAAGSIDSVAAASGRSAEAVYKALQRARRALHQCIQAKLAAEEGS
jgi:RNA polymerase sigma-70 factor (ECF subfamily)